MYGQIIEISVIYGRNNAAVYTVRNVPFRSIVGISFIGYAASVEGKIVCAVGDIVKICVFVGVSVFILGNLCRTAHKVVRIAERSVYERAEVLNGCGFFRSG